MGCDNALQDGSFTARDEPEPDDRSCALTNPLDTRFDEVLATSYRTVFDALDEAFCVIEMLFDDVGRAFDYRFIEVNHAFQDHTGLSAVIGRSIREVLPGVEPTWIETYGQVARSGEPIRFVDEAKELGRWFDVYAWPLGKPGTHRVALHFTDITQRKLAEDELRYRSEQFHALVQQAPIGVYLVGADFCILDVNPAARPVFGDIADLVGRDYEEVLRIIWPKAIADEVVRIARQTLLTGIPHREPEMSGVRADRGNTEYYDWRMDRIRLPDGTNGIVCYFSDISTQVSARHALQESVALLCHHANHDALTGLPNRVLFEDRLGVSLADAERHGRAFALLYLDLDGFKAINDTYGHASGDAVLVEVARRLRGALRASDTLARMHGDEFVAILPEVAEKHEACVLAQKFRAAVHRPIAVSGTTVRVQASIGVVRYPNDGSSPHALLRAADAAMYAVKQASSRRHRAVAGYGHAVPVHR